MDNSPIKLAYLQAKHEYEQLAEKSIQILEERELLWDGSEQTVEIFVEVQMRVEKEIGLPEALRELQQRECRLLEWALSWYKRKASPAFPIALVEEMFVTPYMRSEMIKLSLATPWFADEEGEGYREEEK